MINRNMYVKVWYMKQLFNEIYILVLLCILFGINRDEVKTQFRWYYSLLFIRSRVNFAEKSFAITLSAVLFNLFKVILFYSLSSNLLNVFVYILSLLKIFGVSTKPWFF